MTARIAARWRRLALVSPLGVVLAVGLALPGQGGTVIAGKGDRLPLRCTACGGEVRPTEQSDDAAAGVTTLTRASADAARIASAS